MDFDVKKYAKLAKVKLTAEEEERFQKDLSDIISYIDELKEVNINNISPMTGGTNLKNVFRKDEPRKEDLFDPNFVTEQKGYLKVPKILDNE